MSYAGFIEFYIFTSLRLWCSFFLKWTAGSAFQCAFSHLLILCNIPMFLHSFGFLFSVNQTRLIFCFIWTFFSTSISFLHESFNECIAQGCMELAHPWRIRGRLATSTDDVTCIQSDKLVDSNNTKSLSHRPGATFLVTSEKYNHCCSSWQHIMYPSVDAPCMKYVLTVSYGRCTGKVWSCSILLQIVRSGSLALIIE